MRACPLAFRLTASVQASSGYRLDAPGPSIGPRGGAAKFDLFLMFVAFPVRCSQRPSAQYDAFPVVFRQSCGGLCSGQVPSKYGLDRIDSLSALVCILHYLRQ